MDIQDIKKVLHVASTQSITKSANALCITPGALSKIVKKLEEKFQTPLFDRHNKQLTLNEQGKLFVTYSIPLVHEFEQMSDQLTNSNDKQSLTISGPSIVTGYWLEQLISQHHSDQFDITLLNEYENDAMARLNRGFAHIAIVTKEAVDEDRRDLAFVKVGRCQLVVAGRDPSSQSNPINLPTHSIMNAPFAVPNVSPFCGTERGIGSDGWPDHSHPRDIRYRCDDYFSIIQLLKRGRAIGYIPDYLVSDEHLDIIDIKPAPPYYTEEIYIAWRPSQADGWLNKLIQDIKSTL